MSCMEAFEWTFVLGVDVRRNVLGVSWPTVEAEQRNPRLFAGVPIRGPV